MIESGSLRLTFIFLLVISFCFSALSYFQVPYQFYVWEIFIDLKILLLVVFLWVLGKKGKFQFGFTVLRMNRWDIKKNLFWFLFPISQYFVTSLLGFVTNEVEFNNQQNAVTLVLATVFDIPAIFVFSAISIFIEELFFRSVLFNSINPVRSNIYKSSVVSFFFSIYCLNTIVSSDSFVFLSSLSLLFFFFSISFLTSALMAKYNSIWVSYSFRIGLVALTPLILPSFFFESDSFFKTKNSLFFVEGSLFSLFTMAAGYFLLKSVKQNSTPQKIENLEE